MACGLLQILSFPKEEAMVQSKFIVALNEVTLRVRGGWNKNTFLVTKEVVIIMS